MATKPIHPRADGEGSLGCAGRRFGALYLSGNMTDEEYSMSVAQGAQHISATAPHSGHVDTTGNETIQGIKTFADGIVLPKAAGESGEEALSEGRIEQRSHEDALAVHGGVTGNVQEECLISMLKKWAFNLANPNTLYSSDHEFKVADVGIEAPNGIVIVKIKVELDAITNQVNAKLCYADDFLTQTNEVELIDISTTSGVFSADWEDSDWGDSTGIVDVPNGKVVYVKLTGTVAPHADITQMFTTVWWYASGD